MNLIDDPQDAVALYAFEGGSPSADYHRTTAVDPFEDMEIDSGLASQSLVN